MSKLFNPKNWAGLRPMGLGEVKPHHLVEMARVTWENRDNLDYAWRILNEGVCDGCALGTTGLKDFTLDGIHLCTVRLNLLRLNTMPALDTKQLENIAPLKNKSSRELRELGRLPYPMLRFKGEQGFKRISWDMALNMLALKIRPMDPQRLAFYLTSRGILNEVYYVAQKVARFLGTPHIDNAARICHSPSSSGLKASIGEAASTCSYKDWLGTDVLLLIGSNMANNQPVTTKYLYHAKQNGTKIVVVNTYKEPGLSRYWVPSVPESALFGTALMDEFFQVHTGGDLAFLNGVFKALLAMNGLDQEFIAQRTVGFEALEQELEQQSWADLERFSGSNRAEMEKLAHILAQAKSGIFVWSMGITQHVHGVGNVEAITNLALARGFVGRDYCGLMPIRGHSGVQGGGEMGCLSNALPGGKALTPENAQELSQRWGFTVPEQPGYMTGSMLDAAHSGDLDCFYCVGGNFLETMPDPKWVQTALEHIPIRVHQDIFLTSQMLVEPGEMTLILPATTRYEMPGGATETTTERMVIFNPEIPGPRIGEARTEWETLMDLAKRVKPEQATKIHFENTAAIRQEIAAFCPDYNGIQYLSQQGDVFQWGGRSLCRKTFRTPDGKAHFIPVTPPENEIPEGYYRVSSRRGKQFNSMVQKEIDPLTGAKRLDVLISAQDMHTLGLQNGDAMTLVSDFGQMPGFAKEANIVPSNLQAHWPEGNGLLPPDRRSAPSGVPDYNILVQIEKGHTL